MSFGNKLKKLRQDNNLTQEELAKKINTSRSNIANYENDKNMPSIEILTLLAEIFNCSLDYLLEKSNIRNPEKIITYDKEAIMKGIMKAAGIKENSKTFKFDDNLNSQIEKSIIFSLNNQISEESNAFPTADIPLKIPVLGKISAGLPILAQENIEGYEFAPSTFIKKDFDYFYLKVSGDSMNLKFPEGNLVLVQKQPTLENGEIGVILVGDNEATVKKYRCENDLVILEPMSTNPVHTTQIYNPKKVNIQIIGKVILHLGKV